MIVKLIPQKKLQPVKLCPSVALQSEQVFKETSILTNRSTEDLYRFFFISYCVPVKEN